MQCKKLHSSEKADFAEYNMILHVCIIGAKQPTKKLMQVFDYFEVVHAMVFFVGLGVWQCRMLYMESTASHTSVTNSQSSIMATTQTYLSHTNQSFSSSGNTHNCSEFHNWRTSGRFVAFSQPPQQWWNEIDFSRKSKDSRLPSGATFWDRERNVETHF